MRSRRFVVRYKDSTKTHWGIEHIENPRSKEALLEQARALGRTHGLGEITLISYDDGGDLQPIWNGQRAARTGGNGWLYERCGFAGAFPQEKPN
jgi:hypothetical protein